MEYYGATTTSLRALRHEVFHMYYGCSTVARTYRDSWWDEAIDMWYELSADPAYAADRRRLPLRHRERALRGGGGLRPARLRRGIADRAGGGRRRWGAATAWSGFLRDLHARRSFDPFTTWDLADEIQAWSGLDVRERFRLWLYQSPGAAGAAPARRPGTGCTRSTWRFRRGPDHRKVGVVEGVRS